MTVSRNETQNDFTTRQAIVHMVESLIDNPSVSIEFRDGKYVLSKNNRDIVSIEHKKVTEFGYFRTHIMVFNKKNDEYILNVTTFKDKIEKRIKEIEQKQMDEINRLKKILGFLVDTTHRPAQSPNDIKKLKNSIFEKIKFIIMDEQFEMRENDVPHVYDYDFILDGKKIINIQGNFDQDIDEYSCNVVIDRDAKITIYNGDTPDTFYYSSCYLGDFIRKRKTHEIKRRGERESAARVLKFLEMHNKPKKTK